MMNSMIGERAIGDSVCAATVSPYDYDAIPTRCHLSVYDSFCA